MGLLNVTNHLGEDPKKYIPYDAPNGGSSVNEVKRRKEVRLRMVGIARFVGADINSIMDGTNKKY